MTQPAFSSSVLACQWTRPLWTCQILLFALTKASLKYLVRTTGSLVNVLGSLTYKSVTWRSSDPVKSSQARKFVLVFNYFG
ncbi:uncharacterized protein F5147DRAFT_702674 [Suillus discolor]|uniref:Uncharacterized protein n=1 Tax=Suillus discolor TaxID=1912936 RepID=A0A9P7F565_9AGAM|nr:uncharacterized protein F5147DRAFT_702674 [Suillus discolor]KAG2105505.1 hypothetical protein F5147DRAFT_702674 [Suillus discolor]